MIDTFFILFTTIACLLITGRAVIMDARVPWFTKESTDAEAAIRTPMQPDGRAERRVAREEAGHPAAGASRNFDGGRRRFRSWRARAQDTSPSARAPD